MRKTVLNLHSKIIHFTVVSKVPNIAKAADYISYYK